MFTIPVVGFTGISRVYEGMHSIDQVASGIIQGALSAYLFSSVLYDYLIDLFNKAGNNSIGKTMLFNFYSIVMLLGNTINLIVYSYNTKNYKIP